MLRLGVIAKSDIRLFTFADTPEEAFRVMKDELQKIHRKQYQEGILHG